MTAFFGTSRVAVVTTLLLACCIGGLAGVSPITAIAACSVGALAIVASRRLFTRLYVSVVAALLIGYAFLDRGFAYIGLAPLHIGELGLALSLCLIATKPAVLVTSVTNRVLLLFVAWGAFRTLPFVATYGLDALRDGVTWGYAAFAYAVAIVVGNGIDPARVLRWVGRLAPLFIVWAVVALPAAVIFSSQIPTVPGSDVSWLALKGGDFGVQLAAAGAAVLILAPRGATMSATSPLLAALWIAAAGVVGSLNRGGLLASMAAFAVLPLVRVSRVLVSAVIILMLSGIGLIVADPVVDVGRSRELSITQLVQNAVSIAADVGDADLEGTKEYRLKWWSDILAYTFAGPYFWLGKGFGINLADDDGYQVTADHSLRSPHNGHLTILAREGVTGFAIWVALQCSFAFVLLRHLLRARRARDHAWLSALAVVGVYWLAMMINMTFDPYLEGPQGGIWFWSVFGFGLGAASSFDARRSEREPRASLPHPMLTQG